MAMNNVLTNLEFYENYKHKISPGKFKFITQAYKLRDKTVAIFPNENNVDCYFQLPTYGTRTVPDVRRYIYKLNKESVSSGKFLTDSSGRIVIPVNDLIIWDDPYSSKEEVVEDIVIKEENKDEEITTEIEREDSVQIDLLTQLEEAQARAEKIINDLNSLSSKGESMLVRLKRAIYGNKN